MKTEKSIVFLFLFVFSLASCRKNKTSWDTNWTAPIAYGKFDLTNLVNDSTFSVNPDSSLHLIYSTKIVDLNFDSIFKIPDTTISEKIALAVNVNVPPGTSFINQIEEREFEIENTEIKEIRVKSGSALVTIFNPIETGVTLDMSLPGVVKDGNTFSTSAFVPAGSSSNPSSFSLIVDFTGYTMDLSGSDGSTYNTLQSIFEVTSDPNGDTVFVTTTDSIQINVAFESLTPDYGKGYFGNRIFNSTDSISLDFMKNLVDGNFGLEYANLNLNLINGLAITAKANVTNLSSINSIAPNQIDLIHSVIGQNININPAFGSWNTLVPFVYPVNINSSNSNINSFIENLPDLLVMDYSVEINPLGNISGGNDFFYPNSELSVELDLDMPTGFSVNNLTFIDTMDINFNQDINGTRIQNGSLIIKADNYFPFNLNAQLFFIDEFGIVMDSLYSSDILSAGIPDVNGKVNNPTYSELVFTVDDTFMPVIENAKKVIIKGVLDNVNHPTTYRIYDYYNIDIKISTNIGLLIQI